MTGKGYNIVNLSKLGPLDAAEGQWRVTHWTLDFRGFYTQAVSPWEDASQWAYWLLTTRTERIFLLFSISTTRRYVGLIALAFVSLTTTKPSCEIRCLCLLGLDADCAKHHILSQVRGISWVGMWTGKMSSEQDIHNYKWAFSGICPLQFYVPKMLHMFYFLLLVTATRDPKTSQSQKQFGTYLNRCFTKIFIIRWTISLIYLISIRN